MMTQSGKGKQMEHSIAQYLARRLLRYVPDTEEKYPVYVYGFELILSFAFSAVIIICVGFLVSQPMTSLAFMTTYILIRRYTGGYHAETYWQCKLYTVGIFLLVLLLSVLTRIPLWAFLITSVVGEAVVFKFAPIKNKHKVLSEKKQKQNKGIALFAFPLLTVSSYSLSLFNRIIGNTVFFSLISVVVLMIIQIIRERRTSHASEHL